jgi:hypothetical protein
MMAAGWTGGASSALAQVPYTVLAVPGDTAIGLPPGVSFTGFGTPVLAPDGSGALVPAQLQGAGVTASNNRALLRWDGSALWVWARTGDAAPGLAPGVVFATVPTGVGRFRPVNSAGRAASVCRVSGPGVAPTNDDVLYIETPAGTLVPALREGGPAPGLAGVNVGGSGSGQSPFNDVLRARDGRVTAVVTLAGPGVTTTNDQGLIVFNADGSHLFSIREDSPIPGATGSLIGSRLGPISNVAVSDSARVHLTTTLRGVPADRDEAVVTVYAVETPPPTRVLAFAVAREGDPAPQLAGLTLTPTIQSVTASPDLSLSYAAALTGPGVTPDNQSVSVLDFRAGARVYRQGDQAPSLPAGVQYSQVFPVPIRGTTAPNLFLLASLQGAGVSTANDRASYLGPLNAPRLLAREGDQTPTLPTGVVWASDDVTLPLFDDVGRAVISGLIAGPGVTTETNIAAVVSYPDGSYRRLFRKGQTPDLPIPQTPPLNSAFIEASIGGGRPSGASDAGLIGAWLVLGTGPERTQAVVIYSLCPADFSGDTVVDFNDLLAFLNLYAASSPRADLTGDGVVDFNDLLEFLNVYNAGC